MKTALLILLLSSWLVAPGLAAGQPRPEGNETLRKYADQLGFRVGSKVRPKNWNADAAGRDILAREFNATIVMAMMNTVERQRGRFNFRQMDRIIQFARENNMKIWGSALIYRKDSLPPWMQDRSKGAWNSKELDQIMKEHIQTTIRHGGDAFYAWGVVNEPNNRNEPWEAAFGKDEYISKAFRYAREVTSLPLVLNETFGLNGVNRQKTDDFFKLIKRLKSQGVPIDGAGIEMHLEAQQLRSTYIEEFRYWLAQARQAGVTAYITEMDVYQGGAGQVQDPWGTQRRIYHDVAAACLADSNCKALNIWDLSDSETWLANKRNNPRPDAKPAIFGDNHDKKPAYYGVLDALKQAASKR